MKTRPRRWDRGHAVGRARRLLLRRGRPRAQMAFILLLTGSAGFLFSYALLHAGVTSMTLRYPAAIFLAYGVFLLLLRLWLALQGRRLSLPDLPDFDLHVPNIGTGGGGGGPGPPFGGAGDFGGGGVEGSWAEAGAGGHSGGGGSFLDVDLPDVDLPDIDLPDGDDGCLIIFAVIAALATVAAAVLASLYVVWVAPALLAEILVDGLLLTGLYRRVKHIEGRHWLRSAVRRTLLPVALTLLLFTAAGYLMQRAAPEAHSLAGFWQSITAER